MDLTANSSTQQAHFQVFLSFRGPDTRQGFTNCLYHSMIDAGINVFIDDKDQPLGSEIQKLLGSIGNSKICIPIFSRGYSSSKWCLREVAKMVELKKEIIPIFFDVTPDDVKLKTNLYVDAMRKHVSSGVEETICGANQMDPELQQWEEALRHVGTLSGRELRDTGYVEFCRSITAEVLKKLKIKNRIVTEHLVGMDDHIEATLQLLDIGAKDVRYIGIHGLGGIGKTTLAKVVFNQLSIHFEYCSFLSDVRESCKRSGVEYLQNQLLIDLRDKFPVMNSADGIIAIKGTSQGKKVLIVLDDVDTIDQISKLAGSASWFAVGSRIILTTRDRSILAVNRGIAKGGILSYLEMELLNSGQALQLFSRHVFGDDYPPSDFASLSEEVISVTGNLPLLLEIIGSQLHENTCKEEWIDVITALTKIPHDNIREKLMISYEGLGYRAKQIFLDAACFFINKETTNPMYMWEACGFHPDKEMQDLISKSLVKIVDGKLRMHDHLRDLGREIVWQESAIDPADRSRVWIHEEAQQVLCISEGTKRVEALCLSEDDQHRHEYLVRKSFKCLTRLRFLECYGLNVAWCFDNILYNLRWLSWHHCPIDFKGDDLNLENLVILDLSRSFITQDWGGWSQIKTGNKLKVIDLTNCGNLIRTPNFSKYLFLERLILEGCEELVEIGSSIGVLRRLKHLNVKGCDKLQGLPEELRFLDALEVILMKGNRRPFSLPENIGCLKSLVVLEVVQVRINALPESICDLRKLEYLNLSCCSTMNELPSSLGSITSLVELDISYSRLRKLPDSIQELKALTVLKMKDVPISKLPDTIGKLTMLRVLHASGTKLASLPEGVKSLSLLSILSLSRTSISELAELSNLSSLKQLYLKECDNLQELPKLPSSLTVLSMTCSSNVKLPDLSNLGSLIKLYLDAGREGEGSSNFYSAPIDLLACSRLELLVLNCRNMQCAPMLPSSLTNLSLGYLDNETNFPHLAHLRNLRYLELSECSIEGSLKQHEIGALGSLLGLCIQKCELKMLNGSFLPLNLQSLEIKYCESLIELLHMEDLLNLKRLHLSDCVNLKHIQADGGLKSLQWYHVMSCWSLKLDLSQLQSGQHYVSTNNRSNSQVAKEYSKQLVKFMWPWEEGRTNLNGMLVDSGSASIPGSGPVHMVKKLFMRQKARR